MKNMMLQARNFSKIILCALLLLAAGCKDNNEPKTLYGSVVRPAWAVSEDHDYSSMTAVVKVDLKIQYPEMAADYALNSQDLLAAFAGDKCLGVASPNEGLFYLMITSTEGSVTLRYYSAQYKNLFEAEPFTFQTDAMLGTPDHPYSPAFVLSK